MGKNTDKLYITHSEWTSGGHSAGRGARNQNGSSGLNGQMPFWTCSISQQPIQVDAGVCDKDGNVFDLRNIMQLLRKNGNINPITGEKLEPKELIKIKIEQNAQGEYMDPVTYNEFRPHSQAVIIRTSGNVYHEETVKENNIKTKFWRDLVTDEEFTKKDIIKLHGGVTTRASKTEKSSNNNGKRTNDNDNESEDIGNRKKMLTSYKMSAGFTSTAMDPVTKPQYIDIPLEKLLKPRKFKDPSYLTMETNFGNLSLELYSEYAPKAVYNFISLASKNAYDSVQFSRNIKHTMLVSEKAKFPQESIFGSPFADEIQGNPNKPDTRGLIGMENNGIKNNNKSKFFITYGSCMHREGKVVIFGRVIGGMDILKKIEDSSTDPISDKPRNVIKIEHMKVAIDSITEKLEHARKES